MKRDPSSHTPTIHWSNSLIFRLITLSGVITLLIMLSNTIWSYEYERTQIINEFRHNTMAVGMTIAPHLHMDGLDSFTDNTHASDTNFQRIQQELKRVQQDNQFDTDQIYILRKDTSADNLYQFSVMLHDRPFIGDLYSPPDKVKSMYKKAWEGTPQSTPMFTDDHGTFVAALVPLQDADGTVLGILELDRNLDDYLTAFWEDILIRIITDLIFFFSWLALAIWMYRASKSKVDELLHGTIALREENYDYRIPILNDRDDEYSVLASAVNLSMTQLGERFKMLKFLPRHTRQMIEIANQQQSTIDLSMVRHIDCVIMETDIRGFTTLTESMSPKDTIRFINEFIEVQAEIIIKEEYNGSIDKYMGDAVLVIFEGEEKERRAYECAHHIQFAIRKLNTAKRKQSRKNQIQYTPVDIGIGLSMGRVIMGNMGCEERMEHTVIGSTVNLAARLTSAANGGEIVIHQPILESIGKTGLYEEITVKGFSKPVPVRRITKKAATSNLTVCRGITQEDFDRVTAS